MFYTCVNRYGNSILYRGYDKNGKRVEQKVQFKPTFYLPSKQKETEWKSLDGVNVEPITLDSINEAKDFLERYKDVSNFSIYGTTNYVTQLINEKFPGDISFDRSKMRIFAVDIEVKSDEGFPKPEEALYPVTAICVKELSSKIVRVWGLKDFDPSIVDENHIPKDFTVVYQKGTSEKDLLLNFLDYWTKNYPDIITGWNIRFFDIPYLVNRVKRIMSEELSRKFSPWGIASYRVISVKGKSLDTYDLYGIQQLDYMDLFQKFGYTYGTQESYSLDHICSVVLGEKKMSYEEYGSLHNMYEENHQKYIEYNIKDTLLVERLDEYLNFIDLAMTMAYKAGVNYSETFGTTAIWESIVYKKLKSLNMVPTPRKRKDRRPYAGGYVKQPRNGMHKWIASFDLNSLYPSLIVQYNMSPETLVFDNDINLPNDPLKYLDDSFEMPKEVFEKNYAVAANGSLYRKEKQGILPQIVVDFYDERVVIKKKMLEKKKQIEVVEDDNQKSKLKQEIVNLDNNQMSIKILLNSLYGGIANEHFNYFDINIAEGITLSGQLAIMWAEKTINKYMNNLFKTKDEDYVAYMDTDSLYVSLERLIEEINPDNPIDFIDQVCSQKLEKVLEKGYKELFDKTNGFENRMVMKREAIANRGIWNGKKRYILNVFDNEGVRYSDPKLKIMGIEAVKSSTPKVVRDKFLKAYRIMIDSDESELQAFVNDFYEEFISLPPEETSFPRGVSEIDKWKDKTTLYKKGTPIHVRGSIIYNDMLKKTGLDKQLEEIKNGTKVKFSYLKMPNPTRENIIAFPIFLPKEFGLHEYIDHEVQFNKSFKEPLRSVSDVIGWNLEKINTLDEFFS